jgi:hypothetical protein
MSKTKNAPEFVSLEPPLPESTRLEMEAGRKAAAENASSLARAETSRSLEAAEKAAAMAQEQRAQAEEKQRVVEEAEAAHAAKTSSVPASSV